ncbi:MAG: hypothetical protein H6553_01160 [Chitinophagales bacterium]|nr:hypothetical protein [Chitinophagales bacterium]
MSKKKNFKGKQHQANATTSNKQQTVTPKSTHKKTENSDLFVFLENHFKNNQKKYIILILFLAILFGFFCFDAKVSTANDDSLYIEAGANYAKNFFGYFYTANAPLYPIFLGLVIKLFGIKLVLMKLFSLLFFVLGLWFTYKAFKDRIPYLILIPALLITAINFPYLMYASLTYAETLSFFVMGLSFYVLFNFFDKLDSNTFDIKKNAWQFLIVGAICLLQLLTRNVALIFIAVIVIYFILEKKYIPAALSIVSFGIFYGLYKLILTLIWPAANSQFAAQSKLMFQKDVYNQQLGQETTWGFVERFWGNCEIYISSRFYYVLGFVKETAERNTMLTIISIVIILVSLFYIYKNKQKYLLFSTLYFLAMLAVTFVTLHTSWGQTRLIMVYLPFILFTIFYLFYILGKQFSFTQFALPLILFILLVSNLKATITNGKERFPMFIENINGNPAYGYTPDWQNYVNMSIWCKDNLPKENIAIRKAPMSYIFSGGKEFYPVYNVPTQDADSLLDPLIQNKVNYIVTSELRLDPNRYIANQFVNTMHRYVYYIAQKYPNAFEEIHNEGQFEKSTLYKINYNYIDSIRIINK